MFGTKLHWITFLYLVLEFVILVIQIASCISRRNDSKRLRFFILISLFILFNLSNGFLSDSTPILSPYILIQIVVTYLIGIALGTYYFYYLVKEFNITTDRFYNPKSLTISMLTSFFVGLLMTYFLKNALAISQKVFLIPPILIALYFCIRTLVFIFKSQESLSSHYKLITLAGYIGIVFMSMMPLAHGDNDINDLNNYYDVDGIGINKASRIAYYTQTEGLYSSSHYFDVRQASIQTAKIMFGECSVEHQATIDSWYAVGIGNLNTCTYTASINEISEQNVSIYPNPTNSELTFELPMITESPIQIFDISGKLIKELNSNQTFFQADLSNVENGVYLIHFDFKGHKITKRIIKK